MEKLIRVQASHPHLLTHFHPSHHPSLHLPLSVIHSPTTANKLILCHTLCLQMYLFLRTVQLGFFFPPPESERWLLAPTMSPIRCPSIHPSVISPSSLCALVSPVCRRWKRVVKQAALSKWRQALCLTETESH